MADHTPMEVRTRTAGDIKADITHYNGTAVGASNAFYTQPGTGAVFPVSDGSGTITVDAPVGTPVAMRHSDGSAFQDWKVLDLDSGAGADNRIAVGLALAASGGPVAAPGSTANGLLVDVSRVVGTVTVDSELPAAAALSDATANPTTPLVGAALEGFNGTTWDRLRSTTANGLAVDVTRVTGTVTVDTELPAAVALADNIANPTVPGIGGYGMGWTGAVWERVKTSGGRYQVDVISGGGASTPTNPSVDAVVSSDIASNATADLNATDVGSATKKLRKVICSAGAPMRFDIKKVANAAETIVGYVHSDGAGGEAIFEPPHQSYITQGPVGAGFDGFRVTAHNNDGNTPAPAYATFFYEE